MKCVQRIWKYALTALYMPGRALYKALLSILPINSKQVLFSSFPDYSDNSKVLYQYMISNPKYEMYRFVWLVEKIDGKMIKSDRTTYVKTSSDHHLGISLAALKAIALSKYIFYTHSSPILNIHEKKGQKVINLWHGCGYKARRSPLPKKKLFDFGLVPGLVFVDVKSEFWGCQRDQVIPIGYPRYDQMTMVSEETKSYFNRMKGNCNRVILWMPTYRKTERNEFAVSKIEGYFELPLVNSIEELCELDDFCRKKNTLICLKRHPKQIKYECEKTSFSNIQFISNQDLDDNNADLYGLFACVDGLISDYSSSAIDFLLMDKPLAFTLNDMEDYGNIQGFVFNDPLKYMPGHHLYKMSDLIHYIDDICENRDPYKYERDAIICETQNPCNNYCERICRFFISEDI